MTEQFQHFVRDIQESFLGGLVREDESAVEAVLGGRVDAGAGRYVAAESYEQVTARKRRDYRNGYY